MKWLLIMTLIRGSAAHPTNYSQFVATAPLPFDTKEMCMTAAELWVKQAGQNAKALCVPTVKGATFGGD